MCNRKELRNDAGTAPLYWQVTLVGGEVERERII